MPEEHMEQAYSAIRNSLEHNDKGQVINSLQNYVIALQHDPVFGGHIRRNLFTEKIDVNCELPWIRTSSALDDTDLSFLLLHLDAHYGLRMEKQLVHALRVASTSKAFHPVQERLLGLEWDGVPRLREALHHFLGAEVSDYNEKCLKVFMSGAVERVFHPGCKFELMLVLVGGQGAGKTTFIRYLAMEEDWFSDDIRNLSDDKVFHRLNGHWIMEMSEMMATANAKSIEEIKAFLSRSRDFCRLAYDRFGSDHPRQTVFAGTTNRMNFLPTDRSGNRRFLPVMVHPELADCHILDNPEESRRYFGQMWAEIMVSYKAGTYQTYLTREDEAHLQLEQELFAQEDTLAGRICAYMESYAGDRLCSVQIYKEGLDHPTDDPKPYETRDICEIVNQGIALGHITGWRAFRSPRRFRKYGNQRGWERIPAEPAQALQKAEQLGFTVTENDPDLPWKD
ncbi:MAG: VapE domain-containing protein [Aristaeellaceae bacterium]